MPKSWQCPAPSAPMAMPLPHITRFLPQAKISRRSFLSNRFHCLMSCGDAIKHTVVSIIKMRNWSFKQALLEECNLHTIVRLPNGVFNPYTGIKTNLLFFTKGQPTKHVWYYEHPYPDGIKSYNKTKPMRFEEFETEINWWGNEADGFAARVPTEQAWKVPVADIIARNYNLDIKNPHVGVQISHDPDELLANYRKIMADATEIRERLKQELMAALGTGY